MNTEIDLSKTGVYCITNTRNQKRYVGSAAVSFNQRWSRHRSLLRRGKHHNRHLQGAWNQYGEAVFDYSVLVVCAPKDCIENEQRLMNELDAMNPQFGYNICPKAGSALGVKRTDETRRKLSAAGIGKKYDRERVERSNAPKRGRKRTAEQIEKTRLALLGHTCSAETRAKIGAANRGKTPSEEARNKMSIAASKRGAPVISQAGRARISAARRGTTLSPEVRAKISASVRRRILEKKAGVA